MSILERFLAYADAFEKSYIDDDWSRIAPYFTEQAVYSGGPEDAQGRSAVLAKLKNGIDGLDRKMDSRTLNLQTPIVDGNELTVGWEAIYSKVNCPDLIIAGNETAIFDGDCITHLRDDVSPETEAAVGKWMASHGAQLRG
ncbi:MAG: nuclear transport factor 2 family protein [Pseudomonadales bacterium]|nr:nuclear transport factor 2 family protein [Pseudomonadales bacterium]